MCMLLAPTFQGFFFAAAINSTNEANKGGGTNHITYMSMVTGQYQITTKFKQFIYLLYLVNTHLNFNDQTIHFIDLECIIEIVRQSQTTN